MSELDKIFNKVLADKVRAFPEKTKVIKTARERGRLLAVHGSLDYVEKIVPHCYASEKQIVDPKSTPPNLCDYDVVFIGCPGGIDLRLWEKPLLSLVNEGSVLVTTDWCLGNIIERLFPGTIRKKGIAHGRFPLRVLQPDHPLLQGISDCTGTHWVVEFLSHRIEVLDPKRVQVILDAPDMGQRSAILVAFEVGKGMVVHAISHFHLQGSQESGEYVSAYILTNVIDEAMKRRHLKPSGSRIRVLDEKHKLRIRVIKSS